MKLTVRHLQGPAKHQHDRPTCVAFAATALHEYLCDCAASGKPVTETDLSEEFLYHHCKGRDGLKAAASGTTLEAAAGALRDEGQPLEALCPYRTLNDAKNPLLISATAAADAGKRKLDTMHRLDLKVASVEKSLRSARPVVAVLDWYSNSYLAPLGRIGLPAAADRLLGRHAVLVVGIDDESEAGVCSLAFKNSWGTKWGDNGFGSFSAEYFQRYARELWSLATSS